MVPTGVVNILKPPGITSFQVAAFVKKCLGGVKTGHTGTLDPDAAGVLPICIGKATRAVPLLTGSLKEYRTEMLLGVSTDTLDTSGIVTKRCNVNLAEDKIISVIEGMTGPQMQVPPMYSAVSVGGKRLYELARKGIEVEREPRLINILSINVLYIYKTKVMFDIKCTKGTYVRKICSDIGEKLLCGGCMSFLIRISSGGFLLDNAVTMEEFKSLISKGKQENVIKNVGEYIEGYRKVILSGNDVKRFISGASLKVNGIANLALDEIVLFFDDNGNLLGYTNDLKPEIPEKTLVGRRNVLV